MAKVKGITLILICICIMQYFLQANAQGRKGRGRQKQDPPKPTVPSRLHKSGTKNPNSDSVLINGRFTKKDGTRCTWAATEGSVEDDGAFVLSITCKKGPEESLHCEYTAKPRLCSEYTSNTAGYWKQIRRSVQKQKLLCHDSKALLKAKMCRKAPRDAHFALKPIANVQTTPAKKNKPCPNLSDRQKLAQEYCNPLWSSVCTFLFAMVETEDC